MSLSPSASPSSSWRSSSVCADSDEPTERVAEPVSRCHVCSNEPSTVSYFGVRICTGCRAFFRRSVKCQKTYQCLSNEMCVAGPELQLHSANPVEQGGQGASSTPMVQLNVFIYNDLCDVLAEFSLLKRQLCFERYNAYHGKELKIVVRESSSALHDFFLGLFEYDLLDNVGRKAERLFGQLPRDDWEELLTIDLATCWVLFSQVQSTLRHSEPAERRMFLVDSSFYSLDDDKVLDYWGYMYDCIEGDEADTRRKLYQMVRSYFFGVSYNLVSSVCASMHRAKLDEPETAALLLLLFTTPSFDVHLSQHGLGMLRRWKDETLKGIAEHIERTGRNVEERMAEIIFLMTEFQNLLSITKHAINLACVATKRKALPTKFQELILRSESRRLRDHVSAKLGLGAAPVAN